MIYYPFIIPIDSGPPCNEAAANKMGDTCMSTGVFDVFNQMTAFIGQWYWVPLVLLSAWILARLYVRRVVVRNVR